MPALAKSINVLGALAKIETTYGTSVALTTTSDGLLLTYADRNVGAILQVSYTFDGSVGIQPGGLGTLPITAPGGKFFTGGLPIRFKGAGAAYSSSVKPAAADIMLQIAGFSGTVSTTSGAESWTYTPTAATTAYKSATMSLYERGELWPVVGAIADWSYTFNDPQPPIHTFNVSAIGSGDATDVTLPSITYPNLSALPPNANAVTMTIGSFTTNAVVYSGSFALNRTIEPRVALSQSGGHAGFVPGGRRPEMKLQVEATAFVATPFHTSAGLDPIKLREAATAVTVSVQFGSTQYNKWKHSLYNAQLVDVQKSAVNRAATYELTFRAAPSTPIANDDTDIVFN